MLIIDCSQGISLIDSSHQNKVNAEHVKKDPHIWTSPRNAKIMVKNLCEGLITIDSQHSQFYTQNMNKYLEELEILDRELRETFSKLQTKMFMVYHPAWGYFANEYGLEQIPIEEEGKEPTPEGLTNLINQAKKYNIKVIFASPQFETKTAETVADEINGTVILIDPLEKNYITNLRKISNEITEGLQ